MRQGVAYRNQNSTDTYTDKSSFRGASIGYSKFLFAMQSYNPFVPIKADSCLAFITQTPDNTFGSLMFLLLFP